MEWGGSNIRPEATGYGAVYFGEEILKDQGETFEVRDTNLDGGF
jgi:glutamate dehydrogenase/leucine dehydrogenase